MFGFQGSGVLSLSLLTTLFLPAVPAQIGAQGITSRNELAASLTWKVGHPEPLPVVDMPKHVWASAAPDDPDRLLICAFEKDGEHAKHHSAAYLSLDGGTTWMKTLDDTDSDWVSETSCASGANGAAYFVGGASDTSSGEPRHETGTTEIFRSLDGGLHWTLLHRYPFIDWTTLAISKMPGSSQENVFLYGSKMAQGVGDMGGGLWAEGRGPLLISHDSAQTFSSPLYPDDKSQRREMGSYPVSAVVLGPASIVTLFAQGPNPNQFAVYRNDNSGYEWQSTIHVPQGMDRVRILSAQMVSDQTGKYPGRLYVVFPGVMNNEDVLALAISDDSGKTWRTSVLLHREAAPATGPSPRGFASIAVNREGVVGVEWAPSDGCPVFAVSTDGGTSVAQLLPLGTCDGRNTADEKPLAVAGRMDALNVTSVPGVPGTGNRQLGFWMRVDPTQLWGVRIVADSASRFHAIWAETKVDGTPALLTATIAAGTSSLRKVPLTDVEDLSEHSLVKVLEEDFDPYTATFNIDVVVKNVDVTVISYPAFLEVSGGFSDCGEITYLNASGTSGEGLKLFRVPVAPNTDHLSPGETTLPIHLEIQAKGCEASQGSLLDRSRVLMRNKDWFYTLAVSLRVYATRNRVGSIGTDVGSRIGSASAPNR